MKANSTAWMRLIAALACAAALRAVFFSDPITAQSAPTITSPAVNTVLPEGPDFATDVVGDAWDFSNRLDFALENTQNLNWASGPSLSNGQVIGTSAVTSNVSLGLLQRPWHMINNPGRMGRNFPIDTATYSKLSIKFTTNQSQQFPRFYWWHREIGDPADPGGGTRLISENNLFSPVGTNIYAISMVNVPANALPGGPAWNSAPLVRGLAFYPNHGNVSNNVSVDWVRLTTGDSHPAAAKMNITWNGGSSGLTVSVTENSSGVVHTIATNQPGSGSISWNYGVLPRGAYTLRVGASTRVFTINGKPVLTVTDPDETGGEDFATAVLGNPWDMTDANDYFVNQNIIDHLTQRSPGPGGFTGVSDGQAIGFTPGGVPIGDAQLYLLSKQKTSEGPLIDSNKYHRLTYTLRVDHPYNLTTGSVARVFWGSQHSESMPGGTPYNVTTSKDIQVYEGTNTYTLDLAAMTVANGSLEPTNATLWNATNIRHFRIDPFEFAEVVSFQLSNVKLAADDATSGGAFTIRWAGSDPESDPTTVALYYDTDTNPASGLTLITSSVPLATGQFVWRPGLSVPGGLYYIYAVANDGRNSTGRYSTGPVRVIPAAPGLTGGDFDGDARGDLGVYRNGTWLILASGANYTTTIVKNLGGAGYTPVAGDYDGDFKQDIAVYQESTGTWSILTSSSNFTSTMGFNWGGAGYKAVPGDYDGDGRTDVAVYRTSTGAWSILRSSGGTLGVSWGGAGYVPVGGQDFDGDGRSDIGVYRPATGVWSVLRSSSNFTTVLGASWGGGGYALVPGDYDGDRRADFGLYQTATGTWSVLRSSSNYTTALNIGWGGAGYVPVPGDYDGDGTFDPTVFQRSTGNWLILRSSSGFTTSFTINWGVATDMPVSSAIFTGGSDTTRATDFDGDLKSEITIYQASSGFWYSLNSSSNYTTSANRSWGGVGYTPAPGDYDGDGKTDYGIYQQSSGNWYILLSGAGFTTSLSKNVGGAGWTAAPADYDGDGRTDLLVYNTTSGVWYGLLSSTNYTTTINRSWGGTGYTAAPGDFDGDGKADLSIYQGSSGNWYVLLSGAGFTTSLSKNAGGANYLPAQGDYDADGKADFGVYNTSTGLWYVLLSGANYTTTLSKGWGGAGYTHVRGDFDGDNRQDLVLYQGSSGNWYVLLSGANYTTTISKSWGGAGYAPVPTFP